MTEQRGSYNHGHDPDDAHGVERIGDIVDRLTRQQQWGPPPPHLHPDPAARPGRIGNGRRRG